jgi:hypothetical protein
VRRAGLEDASNRVLYVRWYSQAQPLIESRCSLRTSLCWGHLLDGRPVGRPPSPYSYTPSDGVFRLEYWTAEEVRIVHDDLQAIFPAVALTPDDEVAIEIAVEATAKALGEETGLITTVA